MRTCQSRHPRTSQPRQLNTLARGTCWRGSFPLVLVEGKIGNLSRPASGHLYFTLKDARAQVRCALFQPKSQWLSFRTEGLKVLAGRLTLYEARGDYPAGLRWPGGRRREALRRAFEQLKGQAGGAKACSTRRAGARLPTCAGSAC